MSTQSASTYRRGTSGSKGDFWVPKTQFLGLPTSVRVNVSGIYYRSLDTTGLPVLLCPMAPGFKYLLLELVLWVKALLTCSPCVQQPVFLLYSWSISVVVTALMKFWGINVHCLSRTAYLRSKIVSWTDTQKQQGGPLKGFGRPLLFSCIFEFRATYSRWPSSWGPRKFHASFLGSSFCSTFRTSGKKLL